MSNFDLGDPLDSKTVTSFFSYGAVIPPPENFNGHPRT